MASCTGGFGGLIRVSFTTGSTKNTITDTGSKSEDGLGIIATITTFLLAIPTTIALTFFLIDQYSTDDQTFFNDLLNNGEGTLGGYTFVNNTFQLDNINSDYDDKKVVNNVVNVIAKNRKNLVNINILKSTVYTIEPSVSDTQRFVTE